jgi:hypothetical protein
MCCVVPGGAMQARAESNTNLSGCSAGEVAVAPPWRRGHDGSLPPAAAACH